MENTYCIKPKLNRTYIPIISGAVREYYDLGIPANLNKFFQMNLDSELLLSISGACIIIQKL
jgi:hypothetical protein